MKGQREFVAGTMERAARLDAAKQTLVYAQASWLSVSARVREWWGRKPSP